MEALHSRSITVSFCKPSCRGEIGGEPLEEDGREGQGAVVLGRHRPRFRTACGDTLARDLCTSLHNSPNSTLTLGCVYSV